MALASLASLAALAMTPWDFSLVSLYVTSRQSKSFLGWSSLERFQSSKATFSGGGRRTSQSGWHITVGASGFETSTRKASGKSDSSAARSLRSCSPRRLFSKTVPHCLSKVPGSCCRRIGCSTATFATLRRTACIVTVRKLRKLSYSGPCAEGPLTAFFCILAGGGTTVGTPGMPGAGPAALPLKLEGGAPPLLPDVASLAWNSASSSSSTRVTPEPPFKLAFCAPFLDGTKTEPCDCCSASASASASSRPHCPLPLEFETSPFLMKAAWPSASS
mmetsp:Transcript_71830/g.155970  ORF Transcript_71830/g.155970 Transcript_71830/m.155970 type:complete len:275 (+) Transcript_71830:2131-2955(+)